MTQTDRQISAIKLDLVLINKKKKTCPLVDFAASADYREKIKESETTDKFLDFARELKAVECKGNDDTLVTMVRLERFPNVRKKTGRIGNQKGN